MDEKFSLKIQKRVNLAFHLSNLKNFNHPTLDARKCPKTSSKLSNFDQQLEKIAIFSVF